MRRGCGVSGGGREPRLITRRSPASGPLTKRPWPGCSLRYWCCVPELACYARAWWRSTGRSWGERIEGGQPNGRAAGRGDPGRGRCRGRGRGRGDGTCRGGARVRCAARGERRRARLRELLAELEAEAEEKSYEAHLARRADNEARTGRPIRGRRPTPDSASAPVTSAGERHRSRQSAAEGESRLCPGLQRPSRHLQQPTVGIGDVHQAARPLHHQSGVGRRPRIGRPGAARCEPGAPRQLCPASASQFSQQLTQPGPATLTPTAQRLGRLHGRFGRTSWPRRRHRPRPGSPPPAARPGQASLDAFAPASSVDRRQARA